MEVLAVMRVVSVGRQHAQLALQCAVLVAVIVGYSLLMFVTGDEEVPESLANHHTDSLLETLVVLSRGRCQLLQLLRCRTMATSRSDCQPFYLFLHS